MAVAVPVAGPLLVDPFARVVDYLRLSITDACQMACVYCRDPGTPRLDDRKLSDDELVTFVAACVALGVRKVRITGGEPTLRRDLPALIARLREAGPDLDLSLTTNGLRLRELAEPLRAAGLDRINVSIDTLDPDRFVALTRGGQLDVVLDGLRAAMVAGLEPVKVNAVAWRGVNDGDVADLVALTIDPGVHVRFIEYMTFPIRDVPQYVPMDEVQAAIEARWGALIPAEDAAPDGGGPAEYWRLPPEAGARGMIGFIDPRRRPHFCESCRRLRLTPDGKIRLCLFSDHEHDAVARIRAGDGPDELAAWMQRIIVEKPVDFYVSQGRIARTFSQIGG